MQAESERQQQSQQAAARIREQHAAAVLPSATAFTDEPMQRIALGKREYAECGDGEPRERHPDDGGLPAGAPTADQAPDQRCTIEAPGGILPIGFA